MSRYIGKRVSYPCFNCEKQCTINKDTLQVADGILCSDCSKKHKHIWKYIGNKFRQCEAPFPTKDGWKQCEEEKKVQEIKKQLAKSVACQFRCGDGSGKPIEKHVLGCPSYSSDHSIDVNGDCNMGCC